MYSTYIVVPSDLVSLLSRALQNFDTYVKNSKQLFTVISSSIFRHFDISKIYKDFQTECRNNSNQRFTRLGTAKLKLLSDKRKILQN